jgi:hypothetical protein
MASLAPQPPHLGVDLTGGQSLGDQAPGQVPPAGRRARVVAFVGDGHDLIAQAKGE